MMPTADGPEMRIECTEFSGIGNWNWKVDWTMDGRIFDLIFLAGDFEKWREAPRNGGKAT
jgi:hypothetical protein